MSSILYRMIDLNGGKKEVRFYRVIEESTFYVKLEALKSHVGPERSGIESYYIPSSTSAGEQIFAKKYTQEGIAYYVVEDQYFFSYLYHWDNHPIYL